MKWTDKHGIERCDCKASHDRIAQLEAALRKIRRGYSPHTLFEEIDAVLGTTLETKVDQSTKGE